MSRISVTTFEPMLIENHAKMPHPMENASPSTIAAIAMPRPRRWDLPTIVTSAISPRITPIGGRIGMQKMSAQTSAAMARPLMRGISPSPPVPKPVPYPAPLS
ncbi:MAG: hypothetical protein U0575_05545 [Phycisphaerales bacterium]